MIRYTVVGAGTGLLFAVMDGLINANPLARELFAFCRPIARESVNAPLGLAIDVGYGFVMASIFILLAPSLPGGPLRKGLAFGLLAWFFRVLMGAVGQWMVLKVPPAALVYALASGLAEMLILGVVYGLSLTGRAAQASTS